MTMAELKLEYYMKETNGTFVDFVKDKIEENGGSDTTKPKIIEIKATTDTITFTASDIAGTNENASGVAYYIVSESSTKPSVDSTSWIEYKGSTTVSNLTSGTTYYIYVKDNAGNISTGVEKGTPPTADQVQINRTDPTTVTQKLNELYNR